MEIFIRERYPIDDVVCELSHHPMLDALALSIRQWERDVGDMVRGMMAYLESLPERSV
jgi:hypothetical protein